MTKSRSQHCHFNHYKKGSLSTTFCKHFEFFKKSLIDKHSFFTILHSEQGNSFLALKSDLYEESIPFQQSKNDV